MSVFDDLKGLGQLFTDRDFYNAWADVGKQFVADTKQDAIRITERAKTVIEEPLNKVIDTTSSIIKRAAPAALAACASKEYSDVQASFASFLQPVHIRSKYILIGDNRHNAIGYALEKTRTLSTLSGFTICQNAVVSYTGTQPTQEEMELIKRYLEAGFYIE